MTARIAVTLYCEQKATVVVEASEDADDKTLTQLALVQLDESGGAEWETEIAYVENSRVLGPEEEL